MKVSVEEVIKEAFMQIIEEGYMIKDWGVKKASFSQHV